MDNLSKTEDLSAPESKKRKLIVLEKESSVNSTSSRGSYFQNLFKGEHPVAGARQFLAVIQNTDDNVVNEFLECGGNAHEIVQILDKIENKSNFSQHQSVFGVLSQIIYKCRDSVCKELPNTEAASRHVLRQYGSVIHTMLAPGGTQSHKKAVLEMLTAMVTLSIQLAKELLNTLNLRESTLNELAKHPIKYDPNSVRTHFMRFVLAFFYHDDTLLIKQLLEQRKLQYIILAGLTYDDASILSVLLSTLKEKVVESSSIMKTLKRKFFNTRIMMKLIEVYTWTGPNMEKKKEPLEINEIKANEESKAEVVGRLHELLVLLCTNHKLGVAFVDPTVGLDEKNYNDLVFSVVKSTDPYWSINEVRDLVKKIVLACPDLVAPMFRHFGLMGFYLPEVSLSFVQTCEFTIEVIEGLVAERCLVKSRSPDHLTHLTTRVVLNMNVINCIKSGLLSVHPTIRLSAIRLLNAILKTLQRFISTVDAFFIDSKTKFIEYKQRVMDHLVTHVAVEENLMVAWSMGGGGDLSVLKVPTEAHYYLPLIDLLLAYNQLFPLYFPPVFMSKLQKTIVDTIDVDIKDLFNIKIIKFIIMFKSIHPMQDEFNDMIKTLVPLLPKRTEAKSVLKDLLLQTGHFEGLECEADLWILNLARFPCCDYHLPLLLAVLRETFLKPATCVKALEKASCVKEDSYIQDFNWMELIEALKNPSQDLSSWSKMIPNSRLSVLVPALCKKLMSKYSPNHSCNFVSHLLGDICFSQVDHSILYQVIDSRSSHVVEPIKKYISKWDKIGQQKKIFSNQPFSKSSFEYQVLSALSSESLVEGPLKMVGPMESDWLAVVVRLLVFHAVRVPNQSLIERCVSLLQSLLTELPDPMVHLQEVFLHPHVLQNFNPLQPSTSGNLTSLVLALAQLVNKEQRWLLKPYKQRLLDHIHYAIKKKKKINNAELSNINVIIEETEITSLLTMLVKLQSSLDDWIGLISSLVTSATSRKCLLAGEVVKELSKLPTLQSQVAQYLGVFPHLAAYVDIDSVTSKQEDLNRLCCFMLKFDYDGSIQNQLIKNNKSQPAVVFPALSIVGQSADQATWKAASHLIQRVIDSLICDPIPPWLAENSVKIGSFLLQLEADHLAHLYSQLNSQPVWTCTHLQIAKTLYSNLRQEVDFVVKAIEVLTPLTTLDNLSSVEPHYACLREVVEEKGVQDRDWERIRRSESWEQWVRLALKLGESPDNSASFLLTTLKSLCAVLYMHNADQVQLLAEMVFSHSQFLSVVLAKDSPAKFALLQLILKLTQLNSKLMTSSHIPILLSAYAASLSACDQLILQLLELYEKQGLAVTQWRPVLWGEAAVSAYSVSSQGSTGLKNKNNFSQLLDLFEEQRINKTIARYPVDRDLQLKNKIQDQPEVYDPAFYLPMLVSVFAPSELFYTYKACQSGCLSLILCALSSHHRDVRTVALVALQRFHSHLISNTKNQDTLWLHFLDAMRLGLPRDIEVPRLSSVVTVFLARTVLVLTNPSHPLHLPVSEFVLAKPRFHLEAVPELLPLFNSVDVLQHSAHQEWILSVLRDGIRDYEDFSLCLNSMVFKVTLEYYSSTLASEKAKVMILETLKAAVAAGGGSLLMTSYSLYPWLHCVVRESGPTEALVAVLASLLHKSSAAQLIPLLLQLTINQPQLTESQLSAVLAAVEPYPLHRDQVLNLLQATETIVGQVFEHRTMLCNGIKYVCTKDHSLENSSASDCLKSIVLRHLRNQN